MNKRTLLLSIFTLFILASCATAQSNTNTPVVTTGPAGTIVGTGLPPTRGSNKPTTAPSPTTPRQPTIFIPKEITGTMRTALLDAGKQISMVNGENKASADVVVSTQKAPGSQVLTERVYAVVDWYPTKYTDIGSEELLSLWQGTPTA